MNWWIPIYCVIFHYSLVLQLEEELDDSNFDWTCPNTRLLFPDPAFPRNLREPIRSAVDKSCPRPAPNRCVSRLHGCIYFSHFFDSLWISMFLLVSSQGARYGPFSPQGSRLHGKQPWTSGAVEEDGRQSHSPEGWQSAAGSACYSGITFRNKEKYEKHYVWKIAYFSY